MYRLDIFNNNKWSTVDLDPKFTVVFNYQIRDFKAPSDIKSGFSKTITLYGTPNNQIIFSNINNIGSKYSFTKPQQKILYKLYYNGLFFSSGYMIINNIDQKKNVITYNCTLYDEKTNLLYDIKYKDNGDIRYLNDLNYGFNDEKETYECNTKYTLNNWTYRYGDIIGPNNEKWKPSLNGGGGDLAKYITPIYLNTGLYDDFKSNRFLVSYQNIDGQPLTVPENPYVYDSETNLYTTTKLPILNETFSYTEEGEGETYSNYKGWIVYETERDLHPAEANCIMSNRLPLGISLGETWSHICNNLNIDDSEVKDEVHKLLDETYVLIETDTDENEADKTKLQTTPEQTNYVKKADILNNKIQFFDNRYTPNNVQWSKKCVTKVSGDKIYNIVIRPNLTCSINQDLSKTFFVTEQTIDKSPIQGTFNSGRSYHSRPGGGGYTTPVYDNICESMFNYNLVVYHIKVIETGGNTNNIYIPIIGDDTNLYGGDKETQKIRIKNNIIEILQNIFYLENNYTINTDYLFNNWSLNEATNKDLVGTTISINISNVISGTIEVESTALTLFFLIPSKDITDTSSNNINLWRYGFIRHEINYDESKYNNTNIVNYINDDILYSLDPINNNTSVYKEVNYNKNNLRYTYNILLFRKPLYLNGIYPFTVDNNNNVKLNQNFEEKSNVQVYAVSKESYYKAKKVSKDLLSNIPVIDIFLAVCKMMNMNTICTNYNGEGKLKVLFNIDLYNGNIININNDVDFNDLTIYPTVLESGNYSYALETLETYSDKLFKTKNENYNKLIVNNDYNINKKEIEAIENVDFTTLTEYKLKSTFFNDNVIKGNNEQYIAPVKGVTFKQKLYKGTVNNIKNIEVTKTGLIFNNNVSQDVEDEEIKLCAFDKSLKTMDMNLVLVCYKGLYTRKIPLTITHDIPATKQLTDDFCYVLYPRRTSLARNKINIDINNNTILEPNNVYYETVTTPYFSNNTKDNVALAYTNLNNINITDTLYTKYFSKYNDIFMRSENKKLKCKIRFNSIDINNILRNIYYLDNAYFVINKLTNFNVENEFNEVELIQINIKTLLNK